MARVHVSSGNIILYNSYVSKCRCELMSGALVEAVNRLNNFDSHGVYISVNILHHHHRHRHRHSCHQHQNRQRPDNYEFKRCPWICRWELITHQMKDMKFFRPCQMEYSFWPQLFLRQVQMCKYDVITLLFSLSSPHSFVVRLLFLRYDGN